jgi:hypothetical protein
MTVESLSRNWWLVLLRGIAAVLFGLTAFFWPGLTFAVLVLAFGAYVLIDADLWSFDDCAELPAAVVAQAKQRNTRKHLSATCLQINNARLLPV